MSPPLVPLVGGRVPGLGRPPAGVHDNAGAGHPAGQEPHHGEVRAAVLHLGQVLPVRGQHLYGPLPAAHRHRIRRQVAGRQKELDV